MTTKDYQTRRPLRIFLSYFRPHRGLFLLDISCAFFIAVIDLAFPLISRTAMYHWLPDKRFSIFFTVMALVVAAFVLRAGLYFIVGYWGHTFGILVEADIRRDLFAHMQDLGFDFYDKNRTGQLMSRLTTDLFELTELAHHGPEDLFISLVTIVGALAVMFSIQWRLALVVCCIIPVFLLVVVYRRRQMSQASRAAKQKTGAINAEIESGLSGVRTTKAFANEAQQQRRFDGANEVFKTSKRNFHKEMGFFNASMELFISLLSVAVIAAGGWLIMKDRLNYIDLITFSLYITTFISPVRKLANFAEMFSNGFAGLHRFIELMATEPTIQDDPDAVELTQVQGRVALENVHFSYDDGSPEVHPVEHLGDCAARGDGGHCRPLRRRQKHPVPAGPPVLRPGQRRGIRGRDRRAPPDPALPAPVHRHRAAGCVPVCRHHSGEHPLRKTRGHRPRGGGGRPPGGAV